MTKRYHEFLIIRYYILPNNNYNYLFFHLIQRIAKDSLASREILSSLNKILPRNYDVRRVNKLSLSKLSTIQKSESKKKKKDEEIAFNQTRIKENSRR